MLTVFSKVKYVIYNIQGKHMNHINNLSIPNNRKMTTGIVNIQLPGITLINCRFVNGVLQDGEMHIGDIKYNGPYDENGLLHGLGCMSIENTAYMGKYDHGLLVEGKTIINNQCVEEGKYTFAGRQKRPALLEGSKYDDNAVCTGKYDAMGDLIEGNIVYEDCIYSGVFDKGKLVNGQVKCWIGESKKCFEAKYKLIRNHDFNCDVFESCEVNWDGRLSELPKKYLVMVCCNANHATLAHIFYLKFLHNFDGSSIRYIHREIFGPLKAEDEVGCKIILDNLIKYEDFLNYGSAEKPALLKRASSA